MFETEDEVFNEMISQFNFYKVREVMRFLDWKWDNGTNDIPTIAMMKSAVMRLLGCAMIDSKFSSKPSTISSGGFAVTADFANQTAVLSFVIEESDVGFE